MKVLAGPNAVHICVDMQRMFAEPTEWHAPWLQGVLPAVEALVDRQSARTIFTRFIPPRTAEEASGAWQTYYRKWAAMTRDCLAPDLLGLVPSLSPYVTAGNCIDKQVYSPWY